MLKPLFITATGIRSAIGHGGDETLQSLLDETSGLRRCDFEHANLDTFIGRVDDIEKQVLPETLQDFHCRNNQLALMGLQHETLLARVQQVRKRYGAERIGVFMGTSTSGILQTELAYQHRDSVTGALPADYHYAETHVNFAVTDFVRRTLGLQGPALTVSTACSSSAKVFATASRYINAGLCDAALVGGVDSLCMTTLYGFSSLELVSDQPCRPADRNRNGISIGEAAGFALLETEAGESPDAFALLGYGESSDAHHMSTPHPEGKGAALAMQAALAMAQLDASEVDYINLHGTATQSNDRAEDRAVVSVFGDRTPCSSTKGWTGHTLGAAGIVEAIISMLCIQHGLIPASLNTKQRDSDLQANIVLAQQRQGVRYVISNSFGFGGNNCALLFGAVSS
jgi:3-oxoacyl-[acyl-carrier-protein] synthase-1